MKNAAQLLIDKLPKLKMSLEQLTRREVLVGVPQEDNVRKNEQGPIGNATLAYIHDNGAPAMNIPARPFMRPGIERAKEPVIMFMGQAAKKAAHMDDEAVERGLMKAGQSAVSSIKSVISEGIAPPLKPGTIAGRARGRGTKSKRKSEKAYADIAAGIGDEAAQSALGITPLVNTGQLRNAIAYVLRKK